MKTIYALMVVFCISTTLFAQVDEIKSSSASNSSESGKSDDNSGGGNWFFHAFIDVIPEWQGMKLRNDRERYPAMVGLDVMFQGAVKPSSYYLFWPRIRGNWGLFSTDFRMNYLIEEDIDGYKHIRTNDWQILQLNLVTSRFFTFRLGTGFMKESFSANRSFSESAFMMMVHAQDQSKVLGFEYRFSKDWDTGANPRREFSIQYQQELFSAGKLHGYITAGGVYQKYYNAIEVWGIQAGMIFRVF